MTQFFIMICTNKTESECLDRGLFGAKKDRVGLLRKVQAGDTGFLYNVDNGALMGVFNALSIARENICSQAWEGRFPVQVKVQFKKGSLVRVENGSEILKELGIIQPGKYAPSQPVINNPTLLDSLLRHFEENRTYS